jgi:NhaP-type Na+/H+ or K+/H+ antiporter
MSYERQRELTGNAKGVDMNRTFLVIVVIVTVFTSFLIGFSIPPFIQAGVFSGRKEKGVESQIDKKLEKYYKDLYKTDE